MNFHRKVAAVVAALGSMAAAQTSNVAADWIEGPNPNGAWSFREGSNLLAHVNNWAGSGQGAYANAAGGSGHIPACVKQVGIWSGSDTQPGDVQIHCRDSSNGGSNGEGSIRWTAPSAGVVGVSGSVWLTRNVGRSVVWSILVDGVTQTSGTVFDGDPYSRSNPFPLSAGSGGPAPLGSIAVTAGTVITFLTVKAPSSPFGDFVGVDLSISYGPTPASAVSIGVGCGAFPYIPSLTLTPPRLATLMTFSIVNGSPTSVGDLYFSGVGSVPLAIGGGCNVYIDLLTAAPFMPVATNGVGSWSTTLQIPNVPALSGLQAAFQGVVYGTSGPLGVDLTNGVIATVGY